MQCKDTRLAGGGNSRPDPTSNNHSERSVAGQWLTQQQTVRSDQGTVQVSSLTYERSMDSVHLTTFLYRNIARKTRAPLDEPKSRIHRRPRTIPSSPPGWCGNISPRSFATQAVRSLAVGFLAILATIGHASASLHMSSCEHHAQDLPTAAIPAAASDCCLGFRGRPASECSVPCHERLHGFLGRAGIRVQRGQNWSAWSTLPRLSGSALAAGAFDICPGAI